MTESIASIPNSQKRTQTSAGCNVV